MFLNSYFNKFYTTWLASPICYSKLFSILIPIRSFKSDTPNPYVRANEVGLSLGLAQADIIKFTDSFKRYDVNGNGFIGNNIN